MSVAETATAVRFGFDNSYARLGERFGARLPPTPVRAPRLIRVNEDLAAEMGLDAAALASPAGVEVLAGNRVAEGSEPLAMAYAGHQFGHFVPQLGDGRANLLGEVVGPDGRRWDVQLKGSGPTPFSRRGDGRAALGPVLREYLVSEAMAAMGVPTTRVLAAVLTGEGVVRDTVLPGAVLTRVAASHLRVGSFAYLAARGDVDALRVLTSYALRRHYPERVGAGDAALALLEGVIARQARLVARWMGLGFVHGVMNTDNMAISGETIDYGPCAFLEAYDPGTVFSSIDARGRYAYGAQPHAAHWNLVRLAEALLPLLAESTGSEAAAVEAAQGALAAFAPQYDAAWLAGMRAKLGLAGEHEGDLPLAETLLAAMGAGAVDFTLCFRRLASAAEGDAAGVRAMFAEPAAFDSWERQWRARLAFGGGDAAAAMRRVNPAYIPRNHRVEAVLQAATQREDFGPFAELLDVVTRPYDEQPGMERYAEPARTEERVQWTFCGT